MAPSKQKAHVFAPLRYLDIVKALLLIKSASSPPSNTMMLGYMSPLTSAQRAKLSGAKEAFMALVHKAEADYRTHAIKVELRPEGCWYRPAVDSKGKDCWAPARHEGGSMVGVALRRRFNIRSGLRLDDMPDSPIRFVAKVDLFIIEVEGLDGTETWGFCPQDVRYLT